MRDLTTVVTIIKQFIPAGYESLVQQLDKIVDKASFTAPEMLSERWADIALALNAELPKLGTLPLWAKLIQTVMGGTKFEDPPVFRVSQFINNIQGETFYMGTDYKKAVKKLIDWYTPNAHRYHVELAVWVDGKECDHPLQIDKPNDETIAELKKCIA